MPTSRTDTRVLCPFYQYDEALNRQKAYKITCEGIVDGSTLILNYRRKGDFRTQLDVFCCEHFRRCEIYRMLMEKYEEQ